MSSKSRRITAVKNLINQNDHHSENQKSKAPISQQIDVIKEDVIKLKQDVLRGMEMVRQRWDFKSWRTVLKSKII